MKSCSVPASSSTEAWIGAALAPRSIAVVGASAEPEKIGGRPIKYMLRHGFRGKVLPVNPQRAEVQGLRAYPDVAALPEAPDLAIVAVPGRAAVEAVAQCAARGARLAVVMTSGFGETGEAGRRAQDEMVRAARAAGMRLVGPNTQGIANFANGAIASFATLISEIPPQDGPVAVVSQSGAMSMVPYAALRERGIGVRYSHATGNEADLTTADFVRAVALDPDIRLILLYLESIAQPQALEAAARVARERGIPVVALKAGVSARGQAAASSHTGALATEDRVVEAFFEKLGIWRARDMRSLVNAAPLYLARGVQAARPSAERRVVAISNSGASCVMAADAAERFGVALEPFDDATQARVQAALPAFAAAANPVDLTAALLTNSSLFGAVLPLVGDAGDGFFVSLPMSGQGYDVPRFARDAAHFMASSRKPLVLASPLARTRQAFEAAGVPAFEHEVDAMEALAQVLRHAPAELPPAAAGEPPALPEATGFLSEAESLRVVEAHGIPVVPFVVCRQPTHAVTAFLALGAPVAVKGCSASVPHKTEHGLVHLHLREEQEIARAAAACFGTLQRMNAEAPSVIVAKMVRAQCELVVGARWMAGYGAVVMVGAGGRNVEALGDVQFLVHPFAQAQVRDKLHRLHAAPLFKGVRGEPALELEPLCRIAVALGQLVARARGRIAAVDLNPVFVGPRPEDTLVADALVELSERGE
ncbi:MAG TPA: acetate--CoA ligase family protein [Burkholderiales bacterium]|nr:acetate--CoA ligase family protein [Burkholderiales bacterium]